jgi:hypothetical protein
VSELSRLVALEGLLEVGELEQSLACFENHNNDAKVILISCRRIFRKLIVLSTAGSRNFGEP